MMDRLIVTMNTGGNWIPPNVLASHQMAAARWEAEYMQLTSSSNDVFGDKHRALSKIPGSFEQVMWLDGDILIRGDCPSIFEMVSTYNIGGVSNCQGDIPIVEATRLHSPSWQTLCHELGLEFEFDPGTYINGGMFVFCPELHAKVWSFIVAHLKPKRTGPMIEQSLMNMAFRRFSCAVSILPKQYNRIGLDAWEPGPMIHKVQHLAYFTWGDIKSPRNKRECLEAIEWHV